MLNNTFRRYSPIRVYFELLSTRDSAVDLFLLKIILASIIQRCKNSLKRQHYVLECVQIEANICYYPAPFYPSSNSTKRGSFQSKCSPSLSRNYQRIVRNVGRKWERIVPQSGILLERKRAALALRCSFSQLLFLYSFSHRETVHTNFSWLRGEKQFQRRFRERFHLDWLVIVAKKKRGRVPIIKSPRNLPFFIINCY